MAENCLARKNGICRVENLFFLTGQQMTEARRVLHSEKNPFVFCSLLYVKLTVAKDRITLASGDVTGLNYALMTLLQLFNLFKKDPVLVPDPNAADGDSSGMTSAEGSIIPVVIADQPQCHVRGVLLDMNPFGRVLKYVSKATTYFTYFTHEQDG